MKLSNDVEKYEIEVTKMGQNYSFFLTVKGKTYNHCIKFNVKSSFLPMHYCKSKLAVLCNASYIRSL